MPTLKETKNRIQGVQNTQKITRAMKIVATTRLKKLERSLATETKFIDTLKMGYAELSKSAYDFEHELLIPNEAPKKAGLIVISSDRGLCGAFNSQLFRLTNDFIQNDIDSTEFCYGLIGAKADKNYKEDECERVFSATKILADERAKVSSEVIDAMVSLYREKKVSDVYVIFNGYKSRSDFGFRTLQILPFKQIEEEFEFDKNRTGSRFIIEPDLHECLDALIPLFLKAIVSDAMLQSQTAEELSRMLAMDYATENANELIADLTLIYNRTRQAVITKEISEIVGGAEALS